MSQFGDNSGLHPGETLIEVHTAGNFRFLKNDERQRGSFILHHPAIKFRPQAYTHRPSCLPKFPISSSSLRSADGRTLPLLASSATAAPSRSSSRSDATDSCTPSFSETPIRQTSLSRAYHLP